EATTRLAAAVKRAAELAGLDRQVVEAMAAIEVDPVLEDHLEGPTRARDPRGQLPRSRACHREKKAGPSRPVRAARTVASSTGTTLAKGDRAAAGTTIMIGRTTAAKR